MNSFVAKVTFLAMGLFAFSIVTEAVENVPPYPLKTCVVSGKSLEAMGGPVTINHKGKTVKFCCKPCIKKFKADPDKYLKKLK